MNTFKIISNIGDEFIDTNEGDYDDSRVKHWFQCFSTECESVTFGSNELSVANEPIR